MSTSTTVDISLIIAVIGCVIGIFSWYKGQKKDAQAEEQRFTNMSSAMKDSLSGIKESVLKLNMKTDQICVTTNETRSDIKAMTQRIDEVEKELAVQKRDLVTAFNKIDEIKEGGKHERE